MCQINYIEEIVAHDAQEYDRIVAMVRVDPSIESITEDQGARRLVIAMKTMTGEF